MELVEVAYDRSFGVGYAQLSASSSVRTENYQDRVLVDFDVEDRVVGVEVLTPMAMIPVDEMQAHFEWGSSVWACVQIAARRLEALMEAPTSSGSDGVLRLPSSWVYARQVVETDSM